MARLLLHLGYPKTGTTTLQTSVFDVLHRAGHIRYLGMGGFHRDATPRRRTFFTTLNEALYLESDAAFAEALPGLRKAYTDLIADLPGDGPVVLSNEHFLLSSWSSRQRDARIFPSRTAPRLAQVFGDEAVSLLIGTRETAALMRSMYVQRRSNKAHVNHDRIEGTLSDYVDHVCARRDFTAEMFEFDQNRARYLAAFDNPPLLEIGLDELARDQRDTVLRLLRFMDLPDTAADALSFPLDHHNVKSKTGSGTVVENVPAFLRPVARSRLLSPLARRLARSGPLGRLRDTLIAPEEIPNLSPDQADAIRNAFPANARSARATD
ncbi:sulfotransferase domain-containing protein [Citreimonas sp.]|uniref:sulfotransferase domain-containing protein n=1 Tax=Citreimonas sp. TaxID=3036715 RepID=UPI0035C7DCAA